MNKVLVDYIKTALSQGLSIQEIEKTLIASGAEVAQVKESIRAVITPAPEEEVESEKIPSEEVADEEIAREQTTQQQIESKKDAGKKRKKTVRIHLVIWWLKAFSLAGILLVVRSVLTIGAFTISEYAGYERYLALAVVAISGYLSFLLFFVAGKLSALERGGYQAAKMYFSTVALLTLVIGVDLAVSQQSYTEALIAGAILLVHYLMFLFLKDDKELYRESEKKRSLLQLQVNIFSILLFILIVIFYSRDSILLLLT